MRPQTYGPVPRHQCSVIVCVRKSSIAFVDEIMPRRLQLPVRMRMRARVRNVRRDSRHHTRRECVPLQCVPTFCKISNK